MSLGTKDTFYKERQLEHADSFFKEKLFPLILVCDHIYFQSNIGSIFRICEAFGVEKIIFTGKNIVLTPRKINKTSRNTHLLVKYEIMESEKDTIDYLIKNKYDIICLEITDKSLPINNLAITGKPIALIIGSEISGVSSGFLNISHQTYHIEMFGKNSSMNVVHAATIALYEITRKLS